MRGVRKDSSKTHGLGTNSKCYTFAYIYIRRSWKPLAGSPFVNVEVLCQGKILSDKFCEKFMWQSDD